MTDSERIRKRLPDYFKALDLPWHLAASFLGEFVNDDEEPLGIPSGHARNLFHVAKALSEELVVKRCAPDPLAEAREAVCSEIKQIMGTYREQDARPQGIGTPGGLEHMGDVWRLLRKWDDRLAALEKK